MFLIVTYLNFIHFKLRYLLLPFKFLFMSIKLNSFNPLSLLLSCWNWATRIESTSFCTIFELQEFRVAIIFFRVADEMRHLPAYTPCSEYATTSESILLFPLFSVFVPVMTTRPAESKEFNTKKHKGRNKICREFEVKSVKKVLIQRYLEMCMCTGTVSITRQYKLNQECVRRSINSKTNLFHN